MEWLLKLIAYSFAGLVLVFAALFLLAGVVGLSRYILGY